MVRARLQPYALRDGGELVVRISGLTESAAGEAAVQMGRVDAIESVWAATLGGEVQPDGSLEVTWPDVSIGREAAVFPTAVTVGDAVYRVEDSDVSIVNANTLVATAADARAYMMGLESRQEARFSSGLGDSSSPGVREHRVVCAVERLFVTAPLRLPGVSVLPVEQRPQGEEQRHMVDHVIGSLDWPTRINEEWWASQVSNSRPWTAIVCEPVWASDFAEAAELAWAVRDDLLAVLGLNRGARGRAVATVIEQRQADDSIKHRVYVEDAHYQGNLVGGFTSGESQSQLLVQHAAMRADPLLRLCVDLYAEALAEQSSDARYFRLWSLLETLAGARVPASEAVARLDGSPWPGRYGTTDYAAPRVYRLIADTIRRANSASRAL